MRVAVDRLLKDRSVVQRFTPLLPSMSLTADDPLRQSETMVHLLGSEVWVRAVNFYGAASLTAGELDGATRILADAVLTASKDAETTGLKKVLRLLDVTRHPDDRHAEATAATVAEHRSTNAPNLGCGPRLPILSTRYLRGSSERTPKMRGGSATALSHGRVAMVLAGQGERERALGAFRQGREIIVKLKAVAPSNATLPKDLAYAVAK